MIIALIYLALLLALIRYRGLFGLFNDRFVSHKTFSWLFLLKALAIPAFYLVYHFLYGGIAELDTGKFYHDAVLLSKIARQDLLLYLKLLLGFQNDDKTSYDYYMVYNTLNWDNGTMKDFLYNDNRIVIRVHSLLNFIAFDSYFAHALFSCLLSFIGIFFIYRSFHNLVKGSEIWLLLVFCFLPALWFHTGALLKEGLSMFVLGSSIRLLQRVIFEKVSVVYLLLLALLIFVSSLLKAYLLFYGVLCFALYFLIERWWRFRFKSLVFVLVLGLLALLANTLSLRLKQRSLLQAALKQERIFSGVAKGGIYLYGPDRFIRLEYDSNLVVRSPLKAQGYRIRKNASYMYWKDASSIDTLYCLANTDTNSVYTLAYRIKPSQSNLSPDHTQRPMMVMANALSTCLTYPLFVKDKSVLQTVACFENALVLLAVSLALFGLCFSKRERLPVLVFLVFGLGLCVLVGITSPNGGAMFRYRSPVLPFLCLAAFYYLPWLRVLWQNYFFKKNR